VTSTASASADCLQLAEHTLVLPGIASQDGDRGAGSRKRECNTAADPAVATRDDGNAAAQVEHGTHGVSPEWLILESRPGQSVRGSISE
jgi:hypothetical protein